MTNDREQYRALGAKNGNGDEDEMHARAYREMSPEQRRQRGFWDEEQDDRKTEVARLRKGLEEYKTQFEKVFDDRERLREVYDQADLAVAQLTAEIERLTKVNDDWMKYTIRLLRDIERLREENRSLVQTIRRVLRAQPIEEKTS